MIKTHVASLELKYLFDNQLVSNYLLVLFIHFIDIDNKNIIYDD
jgi:hypothetical protein